MGVTVSALQEIDLSALFAALPDEIFVLDREGNYLDLPAVPANLLSSRGHELAGHNIADLFPPETAQFFLQQIEQVFFTSAPLRFDYSLPTNGGSTWYAACLSPLSAKSVLWVARNISERKRAETTREVFAWLGAQLSEATAPEQAAQTVLDAADQLFGWDAGFINLVRDENDVKMPMYSLISFDTMDGTRADVTRTVREQPAGPLSREAMANGARLIIRSEHETNDPAGISFGDPKSRSKSLMFVPLRHHGRNLGVLSIQSYRACAYSQQDLHVLQTLADFCSGALQRTFAEQRMRESEEARLQSERRFQALIENCTDAIMVCDQQARIQYVSPTIQKILGYSTAQFLRLGEFKLVHPEDRVIIENEFARLICNGGEVTVSPFRMLHQNGEYRWVEASARNLFADPAINGIVASLRDVTDRHADQEKLKHGAYHDALTDLANRSAFTEHLQRAISKQERHPNSAFAVLFLDLDRFKVVNDSLGHLAGDRLLIQVAQRLLSTLRSSDVAARLGGDEFAVLIDDVDSDETATRVAERILKVFSRPFSLDGEEIFTSASIGIAISSPEYRHPNDLLRDADTAMYRAKSQGNGRFAIFDSQMHERIVGQLQMEMDLRRAITREELLLHYQPLVELQSGMVTGFEALVRWQHPERGLVMPNDFIPLAEETDLIAEIGWWVLREACRWMRHWQIESTISRRLSINVNLSARQFMQPNLVEQIRAILQETGLDPRCLKLEITETTIVENAEKAIEMLSRLREMEVQLHVDDFGTGYSSLAYLHRFPIDALKIDRTFVQNLGNSEEALEISRAVIALARNMGMDPIAEGIETAEQLEILRSLGCALGQGYFFSKPLPGAEARVLFERIFSTKPRLTA